MAIKTHKELADFIKDKSVLHLNSLGKDSLVCLHWLNEFAECKKIVSIYFKIDAEYPTDQKYLDFLKRKYPKTEFVEFINTHELNDVLEGVYQSPLAVNHLINHAEYVGFNFSKVVEEKRLEFKCDYVCSGTSKYEGMGRAIFLNRNGLYNSKNQFIFPIGLMTKKQVTKLIEDLELPLNPSYLYSERTHDHPSYFKMKLAFEMLPQYKENMFKKYPLLRLDEYRYEVLFERKK